MLPRGLILVVDDMPGAEAEGSAELARFKVGWHDLTDECRPRTFANIRRLERLNRMLRTLIPVSGWRALMDSHDGGLALERLYRSGQIRYQLLIARLP